MLRKNNTDVDSLKENHKEFFKDQINNQTTTKIWMQET